LAQSGGKYGVDIIGALLFGPAIGIVNPAATARALRRAALQRFRYVFIGSIVVDDGFFETKTG
jgi:glycine/D-amino acid oxidase-like deaminating enzyme